MDAATNNEDFEDLLERVEDNLTLKTDTFMVLSGREVEGLRRLGYKVTIGDDEWTTLCIVSRKQQDATANEQ